MRVKALSLLLLTAGVVAAADKDSTFVAGISATDRITQIHVTNLLRSHDIEPVMEGSVIYGISVPPAKAEQAVKLLRADAPKSGYYIWFGSDDEVKAAEPKALVSRTSVSSALKKPEFSAETALGKFLRSKKVAKLTARYPYIVSISVHERRYLATPEKYGTGYDVEMELQKSKQNPDEGYRGSFQVYDGGRCVHFLGSNEWKAGGK